MVIKDALHFGAKLLSSVTDTPSLDATILLKTACNCDRLFLIKNNDKPLSLSEENLYKEYLSLRLTSMPIAYITGHKEFMGLDFSVNKNVLIPRPDTEILVEYAIACGKKEILDIGTGSGAIAVSLAKYIKDSHIKACDISCDALSLAKINAQNNDVSVDFFHLDILNSDIVGNFDLIVSNPPYIRNDVIKALDKTVKDFEPFIALSGGDDGLIFYREIIKKAYPALNSGGILALEIGYDQAQEVYSLLAENNYTDLKILKDLSGCDRVAIGIKK